uniref:HVA22-like protein n=1 Tax=Salix viminalis TaxID=40686 RepID=A0A6N2MTM9_SALVM
MLGDFIIRFLVLFFGYAYPAFECYKSVEKNDVDIEEIRFWCQYWLPMYGEVKLAFFIYLWYPKTKGTSYIYDTLLKPLVARHETDIERKLHEMQARGWDFAMHYWHKYTELGQTKFFEALQYLASQSGNFTDKTTEKTSGDEPDTSNTINQAVAGSPKSKRAQVRLNEETESVTTMDTGNSTSIDPNVNEKLHQFRMRLRRSNPVQQ